MEGVTLTALQQIDTAGGSVLHAMKAGDAGFSGFGEAYFSAVEKGFIKGWKRHREMTLNVGCPFGERSICGVQ